MTPPWSGSCTHEGWVGFDGREPPHGGLMQSPFVLTLYTRFGYSFAVYYRRESDVITKCRAI